MTHKLGFVEAVKQRGDDWLYGFRLPYQILPVPAQLYAETKVFLDACDSKETLSRNDFSVMKVLVKANKADYRYKKYRGEYTRVD